MHKGFRTLLRKCHYELESDSYTEFRDHFQTTGLTGSQIKQYLVFDGAQDGVGCA